jgi:hypothetical protein
MKEKDEILKELKELEEWTKKIPGVSNAIYDGRDGLSRANEAIGMMLSYNYKGIMRLYQSSRKVEKLTKYLIFLTSALVLKTGLEILGNPLDFWNWLPVVVWIGGAFAVTYYVKLSN